MTLFAFRGAKSHSWTFCDLISMYQFHNGGTCDPITETGAVMICDDEPEFDKENGEPRYYKKDPPQEGDGSKQKGQFKGNISVNGSLQVTG
jgi:hypothetical protein